VVRFRPSDLRDINTRATFGPQSCNLSQLMALGVFLTILSRPGCVVEETVVAARSGLRATQVGTRRLLSRKAPESQRSLTDFSVR